MRVRVKDVWVVVSEILGEVPGGTWGGAEEVQEVDRTYDNVWRPHNNLHLMRLKKLGKIPGFLGTFLPGQGVLYTVIEAAITINANVNNVNDRNDDEDALPLNEDPNDKDEVLSKLTTVMHISMDTT
ncbi:hypothetical protein F5877DRAFT_70031 [Lentinula edodes]|nr:hypothetical protein F5877DRAFT_70031 [Lentinula edodes]